VSRSVPEKTRDPSTIVSYFQCDIQGVAAVRAKYVRLAYVMHTQWGMTHTEDNMMTTKITARLLAGDDPAEIAADLDLETVTGRTDIEVADYRDLDDGTHIVVLPGWWADDGNADIEFGDADSGEEAAQEYVDDGDWGEITETCWIQVWAWRQGLALDDEGEVVDVMIGREQHMIEIDPDEPECSHDDGHDWQTPHELFGGLAQNPGCFGKGGGVVQHEVCMRCGCERVKDTWAQDPTTGAQGLTSVRYEPGEYAVEVEAMRKTETCDRCGRELVDNEIDLGWPIPVKPDGGDPAEDVEYICPDCYGEDGRCRQCGAVLPADEEGDRCDDCHAEEA